MRSASVAAALALGLAAVALTACYTTQEKNARAKIAADRVLAMRKVVRVGASDPRVALEERAIVRSKSSTAVVVRLRNKGASPLSDLPVFVGVRSGGQTVRLNGASRLDYFRTHIPSIQPGGVTTWVFTTRRVVSAGRPVVRVGRQSAADTNRGDDVPRIAIGRASGRRLVHGLLENRSGVPQRGLNVYAYRLVRGRYRAVGRARIAALGAHAATAFELRMIGAGGRGRLRIEAPATMLK